jgi:hypothetical protein
MHDPTNVMPGMKHHMYKWSHLTDYSWYACPVLAMHSVLQHSRCTSLAEMSHGTTHFPCAPMRLLHLDSRASMSLCSSSRTLISVTLHEHSGRHVCCVCQVTTTEARSTVCNPPSQTTGTHFLCEFRKCCLVYAISGNLAVAMRCCEAVALH